MKNLSVLAILLLVLFMTSGRDQVKLVGAVGQCDTVLHGSPCDPNTCDSECKEAADGEIAYGFCNAADPQNVVCVCRLPEWRDQVKMVGAIGDYDKVLHGGACDTNTCDHECKAGYDDVAHGFWNAGDPQNVVCVCRLPDC